MVTPWFMNIVAAPLAGAPPVAIAPGATQSLSLPAGEVAFLAADLEGFDRLLMCSLFSPMQDFVDHEAALATAQAALDLLLAPPAEDPAPENPAPDNLDSPRLFPPRFRPGRGGVVSAPSASLLLRARLRDGRVADVEIVSPRVDPSPIFVGLSPAEAATLAGRLFSLCPAAQSLAAVTAGEAALGVSIDAATASEAGADAAVRAPWRNAAGEPARLAGRPAACVRRCGASCATRSSCCARRRERTQGRNW